LRIPPCVEVVLVSLPLVFRRRLFVLAKKLRRVGLVVGCILVERELGPPGQAARVLELTAPSLGVVAARRVTLFVGALHAPSARARRGGGLSRSGRKSRAALGTTERLPGRLITAPQTLCAFRHSRVASVELAVAVRTKTKTISHSLFPEPWSGLQRKISSIQSGHTAVPTAAAALRAASPASRRKRISNS
jgi:hypothetical protein